MNYIDHTRKHQFIPNSTRFFKFLHHVLYFLNAGGSRISNITFPCVMKVIKVCISLLFSRQHCSLIHYYSLLSLSFTIINVRSVLSSYGCHFYHGKALLLSSRFARMTFDWGLILLLETFYNRYLSSHNAPKYNIPTFIL